MKEEIVFRSVEELYNRVLPALYSVMRIVEKLKRVEDSTVHDNRVL